MNGQPSTGECRIPETFFLMKYFGNVIEKVIINDPVALGAIPSASEL
jgi:hypothetical protein